MWAELYPWIVAGVGGAIGSVLNVTLAAPVTLSTEPSTVTGFSLVPA
jgi:hypothetical protein